MRREIGTIDRLVDEAVASGEFESREDVVSTMLHWLVFNEHINPSELNQPALRSADGRRGESIDDRHADGVSEAEEAKIQYEILRDRDA